MSAAEAQLLFARAVVLILMYSFLAAVAFVTWRELRAVGRVPRGEGGERTPAAGTRLIVTDGGESQRAPGTSFTVTPVTSLGRDVHNDIVLRDVSVSAHHALLHRREDVWWLEDLGSTNGTWVEDTKAEHGAPLIVRSGDRLRIGAIQLRLVEQPATRAGVRGDPQGSGR